MNMCHGAAAKKRSSRGKSWRLWHSGGSSSFGPLAPGFSTPKSTHAVMYFPRVGRES